MKAILIFLTALLLAALRGVGTGGYRSTETESVREAGKSSAAVLEIPPHPTGFPTNGTWLMYCRSEGSGEWREIPVALVRPG